MKATPAALAALRFLPSNQHAQHKNLKKAPSVLTALRHLRPSAFTINYSTDYKTHILHHVIADETHPLNENQKRRQEERPRNGLWWHVTTSGDLVKSSCVRSWARRRLRNAFIEELKLRGYDERGKAVITGANVSGGTGGLYSGKEPDMDGNNQSKTAALIPDLAGSLRIHAALPLLTAKYVALRSEAGSVLDVMVAAAKGTTGQHMPSKIRSPARTQGKVAAEKPSFFPKSSGKKPPRQLPPKTTNTLSKQPVYRRLVPDPKT